MLRRIKSMLPMDLALLYYHSVQFRPIESRSSAKRMNFFMSAFELVEKILTKIKFTLLFSHTFQLTIYSQLKTKSKNQQTKRMLNAYAILYVITISII